MTRTWFGVLGLAALLLLGTASWAGEPVLPFHATLQMTEECFSSDQSQACGTFEDWVAECQAKGYDWGFQVVRAGHATHLGPVTSFEQGCLDFPEAGPAALVRSYVQLTITARGGRQTLTSFAQVVFDFAQGAPPATGTFVVTGGTGRYAEARGSGTLGNVVGDGGPGTIIYLDGSLRPRHGWR